LEIVMTAILEVAAVGVSLLGAVLSFFVGKPG
jgi:hypothetical protein